MKRFLTLLFTTLLLSAALCVSASASNYDSVAEELADIGMFRGTSSGFELDRAPTRSEAAIMLVRLYGAEEEAASSYQAGEISHPFTDVGETAAPYVAWLYTNGITNGTSSTTFGSGSCSAQNYVVFLLRALGYKDGTDFQYADAAAFAMTHGLFDTSLVGGVFLRDDLAALTYQALACELKDGSTYLLDSLIQDGAIDAEAAKPITDKIESYRTLASLSAAERMDTDFTMSMDMDFTMEGQSDGQPIQEKESMSTTASGNIQMVLSETPQMAMTMKMTMLDETVDLGLWLRDGWLYVRMDQDAYRQDISAEMDEFMALYQQLMGQGYQSNVSRMMPFIDSITTKTSGGNTVYTLTLNRAFEALYHDLFSVILDEVMPMMQQAGMDFSLDFNVDTFSYTYTVGSNNQLKNATADMVMDVTVGFKQGEADTISLAISMDMDMTMDINAMGDQVKVSYPSDLSQFPEITAEVPATTTSAA